MKRPKQKYAVIDLEATGTSATAQIIQVGIVIIEGSQMVATYQTDVNPHEPLSDHIIELTGITNEQLAKAPDFSQVARDIFELIEDCVFVAHNVRFDANLLSEQLFLEGYELRTPRVDTVELAQVFFPTMEKYALGDLTKALGIPLEDAHTAIADAQATAQLFLRIREKIESLPSLTLEQIKTYSDHLLFESRLLIDEVSWHTEYDPLVYQEVGGLLLKKPQPLTVEKKYSQDFSTNMALLGLDSRPKQEAFSKSLTHAQKPIHFIQAQAGIGKTYGYLVSLLAKADAKRLVVAVPTKLLQDQLLAEEAERLKDVFGTPYHSIKSPANYLKLDAFKASLNQEDDNRLLNRYKMQLLVWLLETEDGDLDAIKQQQRLQWYFDRLQHDGHLSATSVFYEVDFWRRSYEKAKGSRLLITNHAYLLTRLTDDPGLVEGAHLIIDEAQKLFLTLEDYSHYQLNLSETLLDLEGIAKATDNLLSRRLIESLQFELNRLFEDYQRTQDPFIIEDRWQKIRQDILELPSHDFKNLTAIVDDHYDTVWIDVELLPHKRVVWLKAASQLLFDFSSLLPDQQEVTFVSATLAISPEVSLPELLGFQDYQESFIKEDINQQQAIWVDQEGVSLALASDDYYQALAAKVYQLSQLQKPMLVLLTSKEALERVSYYLEMANLPHLAQGKHGSNHQMKRRFERETSPILLGTGSFWEGVDFTSHDQLLLVITRLPFENPQDFLNQKMAAKLRQKGKNPFTAYSLPVMMMRLKQALGRTTRRDHQRSAVLILDRRLLDKSYGPFSLDLLRQTHPVVIEKFDKILREMDHFLI